ncbi:hypothetical protein [Pseudomonas sp. DP-17]|uniref:hypothetical protein n=1 Tax=Pseudomonas sp. DP-17 TaxID=1580486 RepID=UPI001EFABCAE|nr:hypothetical protein [Pseudomonas sp. DP-17]MCG8910937.1 hypothetical protein [Pseudomonas sp. DP-17]
MSGKPYISISVALVGETSVAHAGAGSWDADEAKALGALLFQLGCEECGRFAGSPGEAHLMVAALDKLRAKLAALTGLPLSERSAKA